MTVATGAKPPRERVWQLWIVALCGGVLGIIAGLPEKEGSLLAVLVFAGLLAKVSQARGDSFQSRLEKASVL